MTYLCKWFLSTPRCKKEAHWVEQYDSIVGTSRVTVSNVEVTNGVPSDIGNLTNQHISGGKRN